LHYDGGLKRCRQMGVNEGKRANLREPQEQRPQLRWLLLATFGGMLLLMGVAGVEALRSLSKLHKVSHQVTQRYSEHSQALQTVMVTFHVYDEEMEQFLLTDVVVANIPAREKVVSRGSQVHSAVSAYPLDSGNEEQALVTQIDEAVKAEEDAFENTQEWGLRERKVRAQVFMEEEVLPTRTHVFDLASALSHLNDQRLVSENRVVAQEFGGLQTRLWRMVVITLVAGLVLSLAAGYYILRLEEDGRRRYRALEHSRQELENLSKRMVEVQEEERRSISRELHDEVGQTLGALLVDLGQLGNVLPSEDKLVKDQLARLKNSVESAVRSIRDMALLLRPPMLDDLGLIPALEWQARETSRRSDMEVEVQADEIPEGLPDPVKIGIYRLVQEALQNAATHAHAKNAKVSVKYGAQKVQVEISDDGIGFQPDRTRGMGLLGMTERVRQLDGSLDVQSSPGKGTTVRAMLPLSGRDSV
jgi:signal transduction histidine kinase